MFSSIFVRFHRFRVLGGPRAGPGRAWPANPGRAPGGPWVGPGQAPGGPRASAKSMLDRGCLNGQGQIHPAIYTQLFIYIYIPRFTLATHPVKNLVKKTVKNLVENLVKNFVKNLVILFSL